MDENRLNSPTTSAVPIEVFGCQLQFSQDPNSKHLGTTVWDASMVFAKFMERNCRKGRFCRSKLLGKRVIELGAGCGLAGFGMAMLGCDVVSTDQVEVLPLLMRNVERNTSRVMQTSSNLDSFGSIQVLELDWGNTDHIKAVNPPFDYIVGTDVVYAEHLLEPLLQTIHALSGPRTVVLLGYEIRSLVVHEQMMNMWKRNFEVKTISRTKMDPKFQHSSIQLFMLVSKNHLGSAKDMVGFNHETNAEKSNHPLDKSDQQGNASETLFNSQAPGGVIVEHGGQLNDWEARRMGSLAARLLKGVKFD